jgi:hypothetical protein
VWQARLNTQRRGLIAAMAGAALAGCGRGDRLEATAHWLGVDHAFSSGLALAASGGTVASIGFFSERPPAAAIEQMTLKRAITPELALQTRPLLVLELRLRGPGRAGFDNLVRYSVLFANMGGSPVAFNRQHRDWVKDGGIELAGEVRAGQRLLGRVRRAGATDIDGTEQPYRWDLSFDTVVAA